MKGDQARRFAAACVTAGVLVIVDQVTKSAAVAALSETDRIPLLGDMLGLQLAYNPGAVLSLGSQVPWLLSLLGVGAVVLLFLGAMRAPTMWWAVGIGFVLGGAIGNVLDRLLAPPGFGRGFVVDFVAYGDWFIGNIADIELGIGAVILAVGLWMRHRRRPRGVSPSAQLSANSSAGGA